MKKFISWRRVSTKKQGKSGLGLEAQEDIIQYWAQEEGGEIIADYVDVYTGKDLSGCKELTKAMKHCKETGATLIIAKTDRFRNDAEAITIYNEMRKNIYFCDCPSQDEFMIKLMFLLAAREARQISIRTKQALDAKKNRIEKNGSDISKSGRVCTHLGASTTDLRNANEASAKARRAQALFNVQNKKFMYFVETLTKAYGEPKTRMQTLVFVDALNKNNIKTASGMEFTVERYRATIQKMKRWSA